MPCWDHNKRKASAETLRMLFLYHPYADTIMKRFFLTILLFSVLVIPMCAGNLVVASFNMRYANPADSLNGNGWGQRLPHITSLIRFHAFDIIGTQECLEHQLEDLSGLLPEYAYIGVGREDGVHAGEHSAIFYRKDRLTVLDHGDFWLSEIEDRANKGWDAALERICTWGKFKDKVTGAVFMFYNLHMDHRGVRARSESARLILRKIQALPHHLPAILTGDFNVDQTSPSYQVLTEGHVLYDSYELAPIRHALNGTINGFHPDRMTTSRIDHVFVTGNIRVLRYGILTDTYRVPASGASMKLSDGNFPDEVQFETYVAKTLSDHFPVMVEVSLPSGKRKSFKSW